MTAMRVSAIVAAIFAAGIASATTVPALPASMIGTWGWDADACAMPNDDGRLIMRERALEFTASSWQLETIDVNEGVFHATATVHEEGDVDISTHTIDLRLALPGRLTVSKGTESPHIYVRCDG